MMKANSRYIKAGVFLAALFIVLGVVGSYYLSRPSTNETKISNETVNLSSSEIKARYTNIGEALGGVQAIPVSEGQTIKGFRLSGIAPGSLAEMVHLKDGDIVTAANGKPVDGPQSALDIYTQLQAGGPISLTVLRNGQPFVLNLSIK